MESWGRLQVWEKMKTLYSESEEEEDKLVTVASTKLTEPSTEKGGASTYAGRQKEEVVVEDVDV